MDQAPYRPQRNPTSSYNPYQTKNNMDLLEYGYNQGRTPSMNTQVPGVGNQWVESTFPNQSNPGYSLHKETSKGQTLSNSRQKSIRVTHSHLGQRNPDSEDFDYHQE
jgi:hypothetical protein